MWYDDSTARLERFSHNALKLTLGLQNLCSFSRYADVMNEVNFESLQLFGGRSLENFMYLKEKG